MYDVNDMGNLKNRRIKVGTAKACEKAQGGWQE